MRVLAATPNVGEAASLDLTEIDPYVVRIDARGDLRIELAEDLVLEIVEQVEFEGEAGV